MRGYFGSRGLAHDAARANLIASSPSRNAAPSHASTHSFALLLGAMTDTTPTPVQFTEDRIPIDGMEDTVLELIELYGGELTASRDAMRQFTLPLRRGVAASGGVECTVTWTRS